jgi:hypothetical protein
MKTSHLIFAAACLLALAVSGGAHAMTKSQVQSYLAAANRGCTVTADPAAVGHIAGTDKEVTIVRYGVESCGGGNNHIMSLAVLFDAGGGRIGSYPITMAMGDVERYEINASGTLVVHTAEYGPNDPRCCPSRKGTFALVVVGGKLGLPGSTGVGATPSATTAADYSCPAFLEGHRLLNWKMADERADLPLHPTSGTADVTWTWGKDRGPVRVVCGYQGTPKTVSLPVAGNTTRCVNPEMSSVFRCM